MCAYTREVEQNVCPLVRSPFRAVSKRASLISTAASFLTAPRRFGRIYRPSTGVYHGPSWVEREKQTAFFACIHYLELSAGADSGLGIPYEKHLPTIRRFGQVHLKRKIRERLNRLIAKGGSAMQRASLAARRLAQQVFVVPAPVNAVLYLP